MDQDISFKVYTYAGGPVIFTQSGRIKPFAHALFGGIHLSAGGLAWSGYPIMAGGGVDVKANRVIAIRLAEFDWLYYNFSSTSVDNQHIGGFSGSNNVRISSGGVYGF